MTWPAGEKLDPWPDCPVCHGTGLERNPTGYPGGDEILACECTWPGGVPEAEPEAR